MMIINQFTADQPKMIDSATLIAGMRRLQAAGIWHYPQTQPRRRNHRLTTLWARMQRVLCQWRKKHHAAK